MITLALVVALSLAAPHRKRRRNKPQGAEGFHRAGVTGCLKGRVLAVSDVRQRTRRAARS